MPHKKQFEKDPRQPGLFDGPAQPLVKDVVTPKGKQNSPKVDLPIWKFEGLAHTDFIGDEAVTAFVFEIEALEQAHEIYSQPVFVALLQGLQALGKNSSKRLRDRAFTIFYGDAGPGYSMFVLALAITDANVIRVITPYLEDLPGYYDCEIANSSAFMPKFRYDHSYLIGHRPLWF
jgi:hypothetical protein